MSNAVVYICGAMNVRVLSCLHARRHNRCTFCRLHNILQVSMNSQAGYNCQFWCWTTTRSFVTPNNETASVLCCDIDEEMQETCYLIDPAFKLDLNFPQAAGLLTSPQLRLLCQWLPGHGRTTGLAVPSTPPTQPAVCAVRCG